MEEKNKQETVKAERRELVKKAVYVVPTILAVVKATERPAYAQTTGSPVLAPVAFPFAPPFLPPFNAPSIN